jgi:hypothetical protein
MIYGTAATAQQTSLLMGRVTLSPTTRSERSIQFIVACFMVVVIPVYFLFKKS